MKNTIPLDNIRRNIFKNNEFPIPKYKTNYESVKNKKTPPQRSSKRIQTKCMKQLLFSHFSRQFAAKIIHRYTIVVLYCIWTTYLYFTICHGCCNTFWLYTQKSIVYVLNYLEFQNRLFSSHYQYGTLFLYKNTKYLSLTYE